MRYEFHGTKAVLVERRAVFCPQAVANDPFVEFTFEGGITVSLRDAEQDVTLPLGRRFHGVPIVTGTNVFDAMIGLIVAVLVSGYPQDTS